MRKHIVISGTGRAGTSFLVELLTHLGLDTGFCTEELARRKSQTARAGLEHDIRQGNAPYVVKSPWFCDYADEVVGRDDICIEHVFIPMRDLHAAAESRRYVTNTTLSAMTAISRLRFKLFPKRIAGGLWHTTQPDQQEGALLHQIYKLTLSLSKTAIPITLLRYPLLASDAEYLYSKLKPILPEIAFTDFEVAFNQVADQSLIHRFGVHDC